MKWRPIETAPRDGTRILCFWPGATFLKHDHPPDYSVAAWSDDLQWHCPTTKEEFGNPTHWCPLEPPK